MGRILIRGEPGYDIVPALAPAPGEPVLDKPGKGAFYQTDPDFVLKNRGIDTLLVCGVTTEVCVNTTVREPLRRCASDAIIGTGPGRFRFLDDSASASRTQRWIKIVSPDRRNRPAAP